MAAAKAYVKARTAQANQIRGLLSEFGIMFPQGIGYLYGRIPDILADVTTRCEGQCVPCYAGCSHS
jgi:hypothetical protein